MTHICVGELAIIGSDNGLSPEWRRAIIWNNAGILLIEPLGTNFSEILIGIKIFSFKKMPLKMSSAKWRPFCLGLNVLRRIFCDYFYRCLSLHEQDAVVKREVNKNVEPSNIHKGYIPDYSVKRLIHTCRPDTSRKYFCFSNEHIWYINVVYDIGLRHKCQWPYGLIIT